MFEDQRWEEVVRTAEAITTRTAELEYYHGVALAQLNRWSAAKVRLTSGLRLAPGEQRLLIELGGLAFKQKRLPEAVMWLRRAVQTDASNRYANDFLATLYFLQGNLEAALKYWNRSGKPELLDVRTEPGLRTDAVLLDRAFAFAPGSTLLLQDLRTTAARISGLGVLTSESFRLEGRPDGKFELRFAARERNGFGSNKWHALLSVLRGVPYQAIQPEYVNISGRAINFTSMARWDPQKRRLKASISSPLRLDPRYRLWLGADGRDERWELRSGSASLGTLGLRRSAINAGISSFRSGQWLWSSAAELSHREYSDIMGFAGAEPSLNHDGYQLKHTLTVTTDLWRSPEDRVESRLELSADTGKIWSQSSQLFQRFQIAATARWMPKPTSDDYAVHVKSCAGTTIGQVPFDELFILGLERDNDLWMRGHVGTHDGRKGSAPMGRGYMLWNSEIDKTIYSDGFFRVRLSPFLDFGKVTGESSALASREWLWDTGVQVKVSAFGVGFTFTYGKDLRSGANVFYLTAR